MKLKTLTVLLLSLFVFQGITAQKKDSKSERKDNKEIMAKAMEVKQMMIEKDEALAEFFDNSEGYVIFPSVGKGGFIVGGAYGRGVVFEDGMHVGNASLKQLDVGLQAGGKSYSEIIFFETEEALNKFKDDKFELSAEVSATIIDEGVAKKAKFKDNVLVMIMPRKGLMVDASIGAQRFDYEKDMNDTRVSDW
ncbi:MAG: hypothetical protein CL613_03015 [Aquimarina sp.]|nr:hypothetical protein [Aquimarina sp.]